MGSYNLTINGSVDSKIRIFNLADTGTLTTGNDNFDVRWFSADAAGNSGYNYAPAWVRAVALASAAGVAGSGATVLCGGGVWYMGADVPIPDGSTQMLFEFEWSQFITTVNNTPLFVPTTTAGSGDPSNITFKGMLRHSYSTAQTPADTASLTLAHLSSVGGNDGCWGWSVDWIECINGYGGVGIHPSSSGSSCCGFWDSDFFVLTDQGLAGPLYAVAPATGGLEGLHLGRVTGINGGNAQTTAARMIHCGSTGQLIIDTWHYDDYGSGSSLAGGAIFLEECINYSIGIGHIEGCTFGSGIAYGGVVDIDGSSSSGSFAGCQFAGNFEAAGYVVSIVVLTGDATCNLTGPINTSATTLGSGGHVYCFDINSGCVLNAPANAGFTNLDAYVGIIYPGNLYPVLGGILSGTYSHVTGLTANPFYYQMAVITDSTTNTLGANITAGGGSYSVLAMFVSTGYWVVLAVI